MNKKTKALTTEQYKEIIAAMREGSAFFRPNERAATALVLEGNLGLRISDIIKLRPCDIVKDGERYPASSVKSSGYVNGSMMLSLRQASRPSVSTVWTP